MNTKGLTIHVAYAEDQYGMRMGIERILSNCNNISLDILAANGKELIEQLEATQSLPDICMIDLNMPVMNGFELQQELRKHWPEIRTLVLTAHDNQDFVIKMISLGVSGYILKESGANNEIPDAIRSIYEKGHYYSRIAGHAMFNSVKHNIVKPLHFSGRELEFLKLAFTNLSYTEIAERMNVSLKGVEGYRYRLFHKLNINNRSELIKYVLETGIVTMEIPNQINLFKK